ncbi:uncharacterized protein LOC114303520 [Camellia sinensis]|uniref:uncharacterized protein LOC114303520 n=1 Tax=Camellia sinensis TaxID=4442 RepID=UPI001036F1BC|nr:uncharacterized protein LOC114303520 [Camellia sinensis]
MSRPRPPSKALVPSSDKPPFIPSLELVTQYHPIEMINRYQVLGNIPRPNYSSALATNPFASPSQTVSITPFPANPIRFARSDYVKSTTTNLFFKEPSHPRVKLFMILLNPILFTPHRIVEIVQAEFPIDQCALTPVIIKAQQNPVAVISQGSPNLPPINLGSPSSSGSKPKSSKSKFASSSDKTKSKAKSKAPAISTQPKTQSKPKSDKSKVAPSKPKVKPGSASDQLLQMARLLMNQAQAQLKDDPSDDDPPTPAQKTSSEDSLDSSQGSTNQDPYGPELQDAQDPYFLPQPPKDFCKNFYPSKDFKRLLGLPVEQRKAPLLLNYIPTYKSVLPDNPRKSKSPPSVTTPATTSSLQPDQGSTSDPAEQPSTSAPQLIPPSQCKRRRRTVAAIEMGFKKAVVDDLLADIPNIITLQSSSSQSQPKPKQKRLKKAQAKATVTQIDSEDTLPTSKMAEAEKSASAAEKRPAKAAPSESTRSKKPRSESATTSGSMKSNAPWAPPITIEDKPVGVGDSTTDLEVGIALSTALLLPKDLKRNTEVSEYENFALMLQHFAIQHAHSFTMQAFNIKKELVNKTKEATSLLKIVNRVEAKMKTLMDQTRQQDEAEERAGAAEAIAKVLEAEKKEAEAKIAEAQAKLIAALATKDAEIKAADEKAYAEGTADVKEDYKKQVKPACNKGFTLGWMDALTELAVFEDFPLKNASNLVQPFPPTPSQSEDEVESEEEAEAEKSENAVDARAKVSKNATLEKTTSDAPIAEKSIDQTL